MEFFFLVLLIFAVAFLAVMGRSLWADGRASTDRRWLDDFIEDETTPPAGAKQDYDARSRLWRKRSVVSEKDHARAIFWRRDPIALYPKEIQALYAKYRGERP